MAHIEDYERGEHASALESLVDDPFDDHLEPEIDSELAGFIERSGVDAPGRGREAVTALSALSQQMSAYRPLSVEEQNAFLAQYWAGMEASARLGVKRKRSDKLEHQLRAQVRTGEQAQMALIGSMFRLVMMIARELSSNRFGKENSLAMLEDLVADANVELVEALPRFDPARVPSFSAYAGRVARDRIRSSLHSGAHIQIPSAWLRINAIATTRVPELEIEYGRQPTVPEIQAALLTRCMQWAHDHLTPAQAELDEPERLALMRAKLVKQGMIGAIERYEEVVQFTRPAVSLDAPLGDDSSGTYADWLKDERADATFTEVEAGQMRDDIAQVLAGLNEREQGIFMRRFGWLDGESWTYAKLAPLYGISAERVRQIEASVLARLRGPDFAHLRAYLPGAQDDIDDQPDIAPAPRSGNVRNHPYAAAS